MMRPGLSRAPKHSASSLFPLLNREGWRGTSRGGFLLLSALALLAPALPARADGPASSAFVTAAAPAPAPTVPAPALDYVLSPDDQIDISVLGHEDFKASVTILPDGAFNYPVVGRVHAAGQTVDGLRRTLTRGLGSQLNQPDVTVTLRAGRARKVSLLGAGAKTAGQYDYKQGMHLLDLLAESGGPAAVPELTQATLVTGGGKDSVPINLPRLLSGADTSQNLPLAPGDILFLTPRDAAVAQVQVIGEVLKPGAYSVTPDGSTLLSLVTQAGGATPKAALTQAQVMHGGRVTVYDLRPLLTRDLSAPAGRVRLAPGDVLLVPTNEAHILALGEVGTKGVLPIPDGQTLPLTVALAQVGGVTAEGDKKNVDIVRRGPDGHATVLVVNADDLLRGKNNVADLNLRNGDILYVQTRNHPQSIGSVLGSIGVLGVLGPLSRLGR